MYGMTFRKIERSPYLFDLPIKQAEAVLVCCTRFVTPSFFSHMMQTYLPEVLQSGPSFSQQQLEQLEHQLLLLRRGSATRLLLLGDSA